MNKNIRFRETSFVGATVVQYKYDNTALEQNFTEDIGGLAAAIAYAKSHGHRKDLADFIRATHVVLNGEVVYAVSVETSSH